MSRFVFWISDGPFSIYLYSDPDLWASDLPMSQFSVVCLSCYRRVQIKFPWTLTRQCQKPPNTSVGSNSSCLLCVGRLLLKESEPNSLFSPSLSAQSAENPTLKIKPQCEISFTPPTRDNLWGLGVWALEGFTFWYVSHSDGWSWHEQQLFAGCNLLLLIFFGWLLVNLFSSPVFTPS